MSTGRQHPATAVEVLVIGGGVVGAAAALAVANRGHRVALVEQGSLSAARGSSKGTARIFVPAAYPDESFLELGRRAMERWATVESAAAEELLVRTGALSRGDFAERQTPLLRAAGVEAELLRPADAQERFGLDFPDDAPILHQPDAGVIRADRAISTLLRMAAAAGAMLHEAERVLEISEHGNGVEVETTQRRWTCGSAIVAAGPWAGGLLATAGINVPLSTSVQSVGNFKLARPAARPVALIEFGGEEPFACWDPRGGLKAGFHARGPTVSMDPGSPRVEPETIARLAEWVGARFARLGARLEESEACVYTNAPDERFMIERYGHVVVAAACNGQGFQFAPETGARAADLALGGAGASGPRKGGT
jgi:sarcosine oxidase